MLSYKSASHILFNHCYTCKYSMCYLILGNRDLTATETVPISNQRQEGGTVYANHHHRYPTDNSLQSSWECR